MKITGTSLLFFAMVCLIVVLIISALVIYILIQSRTRKKLWEIAYLDSLTGLGNLAKFKADARELLSAHPDTNYVIIKFDIDRFNLINEMYGFDAGDIVLKSIALALQVFAKHYNGLTARVGSDDFVLMVTLGAREPDDLWHSYTEKLKHFVFGKTGCTVLFSGGRYVISLGDTNINDIYEKVNYAHNAAKKNGIPEKIIDYNIRMKKTDVLHRELENRMEEALKNHEFCAYIQPKYTLEEGFLVGGEALVRWLPEDGSMVSPASFIPLFEKNGFVVKLDLFMFESVCKIIESWIKNGMQPVTISVNFSRLHLQNKQFVQSLVKISDQYAIPKHCLEIELTESVMLNAENILEQVLLELHQAGFTLSMDDFGTGYSSLGLLKNLPIDVIKIDRSFFSNTKDIRRSKIVIANVMSMAKELAILTVAEGVENREDIEFLRETGCDIVQGYYFARPMPVADFTNLLAGQNSN